MTWFSENSSVWGHSNGSFVCSPVSPKCIIKFRRPILPVWTHSFFKYSFNLPVGNFCLPLIKLKAVASSPTLKVRTPFCISIRAAPVARNYLPNRRGTCESSSMSKMMKSTGKKNFPTVTSTSSKTPSGCTIDLSAI